MNGPCATLHNTTEQFTRVTLAGDQTPRLSLTEQCLEKDSRRPCNSDTSTQYIVEYNSMQTKTGKLSKYVLCWNKISEQGDTMKLTVNVSYIFHAIVHHRENKKAFNNNTFKRRADIFHQCNAKVKECAYFPATSKSSRNIFIHWYWAGGH